jgi:predicted PhzF superfamily epimerase YddE/YHI9
MSQPVTVVDAFTDRPFAGNPAAVCVLREPKPNEWMQQVAAELNLAETAFLLRSRDGFALRWFTPTVEVDLCGHATLASAHVLYQDAYLPREETARFHTRSGLLTASLNGTRIMLDFPATPPAEERPPSDLLSGLRLESARWIGRSRFDYLVEVGSEAEVRALAPEFAVLGRLEARGAIVTSRADGDQPYDFVSRFFAPGAGIPEDPVTGSAHCALAPYWRSTFGRDAMVGYQASARGGTVYVECRGNRVMLGGNAVTVWTGYLR